MSNLADGNSSSLLSADDLCFYASPFVDLCFIMLICVHLQNLPLYYIGDFVIYFSICVLLAWLVQSWPRPNRTN